MKTKEFIEWLRTTGWCKNYESNNSSDWRYDINYADCIYDELTVWYNEKRVSVSYNNIGWGYREIENYDFSYEEFIEWNNMKNL